MTMNKTPEALPDIKVVRGKADFGNVPSAEMKTGNIDEKYDKLPRIRCKAAKITGFRTFMGLVFFLMFGAVSLAFLLMDRSSISVTINGEFSTAEELGFGFYLFLAPFMAVSIGALIVMVLPFIRLFMTNLLGEELDATVIGYTGSNLFINGVQALDVNFKVSLDGQDCIIEYGTEQCSEKWPVGSSVGLKKYKNFLQAK